MKTKIKKQWIAALLSGDYKQGRGRLALIVSDDETRYCCLGVLCELAVKEGIVEKEKAMDGYHYKYFSDHDVHMSVLPKAVQTWAGLDTYYGWQNLTTGQSLTSLNDAGRSFENIAQVIEEKL